MSFSLYVLISMSFFVYNVVAEPRATEAALICSNRTATASQRQDFIANFLAAMKELTSGISSHRYAAVKSGSGNETVYAFGECMKDLSQDDCNICFAKIKTRILSCLPFQLAIRGGRAFYDGCYIRYDDYNFFNETLSAQDLSKCGSKNHSGNQTVFGSNALALVRNLSVEAPNNDGFSAGSVTGKNVTVYGLAECWELVRGNACRNCLVNAASRILTCVPKDEGRVLNAGCYLRYSPLKFYNNSATDAARDDDRHSLATILATVFFSLAFLMVTATAIFFLRKRLIKMGIERKQLGALVVTVNESKLNFSYGTLEKATNYFHISNKLGQGGAGAVYKGVLLDGRVVAIKRLFFITTQWVDHFFNEVNLISDIDHKNLVRLLGCSITGPESLLVYEYVPNQSLNDCLFVRKDIEPLKWQTRCKIILGTAEGLAYLHEESKHRIIHRDIKLSNILLDEDFTPKIADFGLARLFPEDKTHVSTAVAGTLGYMAPEYIVRGKLTEKVDIYSFGVVLIETVCGRRNSVYFEDSYSILQMVWNLYGIGRLWEAVDPALKDNFPVQEASQILHIGLLCVQAAAELRPPMSTVVKMLTGHQEIPNPAQPPFLSSSSTEISPNVQPGSSDSPSSNTESLEHRMTGTSVGPR